VPAGHILSVSRANERGKGSLPETNDSLERRFVLKTNKSFSSLRQRTQGLLGKERAIFKRKHGEARLSGKRDHEVKDKTSGKRAQKLFRVERGSKIIV